MFNISTPEIANNSIVVNENNTFLFKGFIFSLFRLFDLLLYRTVMTQNYTDSFK